MPVGAIPFCAESLFAILLVCISELAGVIGSDEQFAGTVVARINFLEEAIRPRRDGLVSANFHRIRTDGLSVSRFPDYLGKAKLIKPRGLVIPVFCLGSDKIASLMLQCIE